ncbi:hypothetical protein D9M71_810850 [compost metagenome]
MSRWRISQLSGFQFGKKAAIFCPLAWAAKFCWYSATSRTKNTGWLNMTKSCSPSWPRPGISLAPGTSSSLIAMPRASRALSNCG